MHQNSVNCKFQDPESADLEARSPKTLKRRRREGWKTEIARKKRMQGQAYTGYKIIETESGRKRLLIASRPPRLVGPACSSKNCFRTKLRACNEFPESVRNEILREFWTMEWSAKKTYVTSLIDKVDPKYPE